MKRLKIKQQQINHTSRSMLSINKGTSSTMPTYRLLADTSQASWLLWWRGVHARCCCCFPRHYYWIFPFSRTRPQPPTPAAYTKAYHRPMMADAVPCWWLCTPSAPARMERTCRSLEQIWPDETFILSAELRDTRKSSYESQTN